MKYPDHLDDIFDELTDLTVFQRHTLKERYRFLMAEYRYRCRLFAALFYTFRITMTVGSLAVPALLSIQAPPNMSASMYWFTWGLSLAVTTANGITTLFKLDKRFFALHATAERIRSETWQFLQLAGRYSGHHGHRKPTHANQVVYYCSQLEKINMKRVDEEYIKAGEDAHNTPAASVPAGQKPTGDTMVPSPPDQGSPDKKPSAGDSIEIVGDANEDEEDKKSTVQMSGQPQPTLSAPADIRLNILQPTPKL